MFIYNNWHGGNTYRYKKEKETLCFPSIPIILYYDEVDCSSFASSPGLNMTMVYLTNIYRTAGKLQNIHRTAIAYSSVEKKCGLGKLMTYM